jgi:hypothetical protein
MFAVSLARGAGPWRPRPSFRQVPCAAETKEARMNNVLGNYLSRGFRPSH